MLRGHWRTGKRLWLRHTYPGDGQVVSGQTWTGGGVGGGRVRSWVRVLRAAGATETDPGLRAAHDISDSRGNFPRDDDRGRRAFAKSAAGIPAGGMGPAAVEKRGF